MNGREEPPILNARPRLSTPVSRIDIAFAPVPAVMLSPSAAITSISPEKNL